MGKSNAWIMFQSTRPVRGATGAADARKQMGDVSIHAPRAGRDLPHEVFSLPENVSIHAPRAGRDFTSARHRTTQTVSIHAPRAGRDSADSHRRVRRQSFNPRAPCGARQLY
ncbi:hypothetical protein HMPREF9162_2210 [Selenomonas sp. oral taxon 137 str. F0430]|nr:hypothetical protein HMPREF9162_2210 [Selenomonas sp. oral taxon 137 str. F0430]